MGWILYREGKLDEAKGYLRASFLNDETTDVAEHLAVVMEASGDKAAALAAGGVEKAEKMGDKDPEGAQEMLKKARLTDFWCGLGC